MIRINLLPVRAAKKKEFGRQVLGILALVVLLAVVANFIWWKQLSDDADQLDKRNKATQAEIAQLEKTIGEVKSITQEQKAIKEKLKILENLKAGRVGPVKLMDELSSLIPVKVWLNGFSQNGSAIGMNGRAANYEELSSFSKKLKTSKRFKDVVIRSAAQGGDGIVNWEISCTADYSA